ncbi:MAG: VWA domain-containing protein [Candidatus Omnitrophica bacterium]|nr:VWA domain-containing protein [Candidatus Omnitrophota bacterium]
MSVSAGSGAQYEPYYANTSEGKAGVSAQYQYRSKDSARYGLGANDKAVLYQYSGSRAIVAPAAPSVMHSAMYDQSLAVSGTGTYLMRESQETSYYSSPVRYIQPMPVDTEEYKRINENEFLLASVDPLSTLSTDVDTASYSNVRRFLSQRQMPPADAVRIEEMVNYFSYDYPQPWFGQPFSITTDLAACPWAPGHQLMRIGLKGKIPSGTNLPPSNLVFLIDVSGSMSDGDKLPLLKEGFKMMVQQLRAQDYVSIVVYAGNAGQVLAPTSGADKYRILSAIDSLNAGGSTAGGEGIQLAYRVAQESFISGGNNRVILATDGDFNVGIADTASLERMIEEKRKAGVFLTILGFGQGNLKDGRMQSIADKGNGNYSYIDSLQEARKVLVEELGSTLFTIAKDVKIQVEFNPAAVKAYRLIGYEKRLLAKEDFNNDQKDAGEIGAGHTVTALYEIVPAGAVEGWSYVRPGVDPLKYQAQSPVYTGAVNDHEVATVKLRYKEPDGDASKLIAKTVKRSDAVRYPKGDFAWASAVAEFGMLLRGSEFRGYASYDRVLNDTRNNIGNDPNGLRAEFISLVETARSIMPQPQPVGYDEPVYRIYSAQGDGQINFK